MRNLLIFGLFVIALVMVQFAQAQTVDDVIDKYVAAMGGKDKMMSMTTLRMTGAFNIQGNDVNIVSTRKHLVGLRMDITVMGTENYQIITPTKGTAFMPVQGQSSPEDINEDQLKAGVNQLDLQGPFLNYKEKGNTVTLAGKETVDGAECYKLSVTFKNGVKATYFIDSKTYRINKLVSKIMQNGEETDSETTYSNYKQNADGFWFPYTNVSSRGETNYEKIETNIKVEDTIFQQ